MVAWLDDETGEVCRQPYQVPTDRVPEVLAAMPEPKRVAMEVSGSSLFLARQLKSCAIEVLVVDAFKSHRLLEARHKAKTDQLDAGSLLLCLVDGLLDHCPVWVPNEPVHEVRCLTRTREQLVEQSSSLRCQIRARLLAQGARCPYQNLLGRAATCWLDQFEAGLPPLVRLSLRALRRSLEALHEQIRALEAAMREAARGQELVQRLQTVAGCGVLTALTLVAEIGDVHRFADAAHLRSYTGLTPRQRQSGERSSTGPLDKRGNPHLRRILVLMAQHFSHYLRRHDCRMARRYQRCFALHGPNPAKVALARDLCDLIFTLWRQGTEFDPARLGVAQPAQGKSPPVGVVSEKCKVKHRLVVGAN
jgi:transposase